MKKGEFYTPALLDKWNFACIVNLAYRAHSTHVEGETYD